MSYLHSFNFLAKLLETHSNAASELKILANTSGRTTESLSSKFEVIRLNKSLIYFELDLTLKFGWHPNDIMKLQVLSVRSVSPRLPERAKFLSC